MSETVEQRNLRFAENRAKVVAKVKSLNPDAIVNENGFIHYTVSVVKSKVVTEKHTRHIYGNDTGDNMRADTYYFTQKDAENAIMQVMPEAKEKFEKCLDAYTKLTQDLGFSKGFSYSGDTHGIYNEYDYIYFKIKGFNFQFEV